MKKFFWVVILVMVVGCSLGNNPTSLVENLLGDYQRLDDGVVVSYTRLVSSVDEDLVERYNDVVRSQYENLSYEIKDEEIDGDKAVVTAVVSVKDYGSVIENYDYNDSDYDLKVLEGLENVSEKVTYTILFNLSKGSDGKWSVDDLTTEIYDKLLGIY